MVHAACRPGVAIEFQPEHELWLFCAPLRSCVRQIWLDGDPRHEAADGRDVEVRGGSAHGSASLSTILGPKRFATWEKRMMTPPMGVRGSVESTRERRAKAAGISAADFSDDEFIRSPEG